MITSYFRSSSYSKFDYCELSYYLEYVLGHYYPAGQKAEQGTIVHKVLECLAVIKKEIQDNPSSDFIDDPQLGKIEFDSQNWMNVKFLTKSEVAKVNLSRKAKTIYKSKCTIEQGHMRRGVDLVEHIFDKAYNYYKDKSDHNWKPANRRDCHNWTWMALDYRNGMFDPRQKKIVDAEPHFDITIDRPWAKFEYEDSSGKIISGNLAIKGTIDLITEVGPGILEICDWKGLPTTTKIPTPNGWTTMGDLKVEDSVFDKDGHITKVLGKSQKKIKSCYEIQFDDTSKVICDDEHLWMLDNGNVVSILDLKIKDKIDVAKPLKYKSKTLPIDPYVLGTWLGDGRNRSGEITSGDKFVFDEISKRGYTLGPDLEKRTDNCSSRTPYGLTTKLRALGLLHNKHIPEIYLQSSITQRLDLLRGLMDSDGNVNVVRKQSVFTNCNKRLSDDTKELLLSLGQRPCQSDVNHKYLDRIVKVYPIAFRPIDINPFLLPRKADKIDKNWGYGNSNKRRVSKITKLNGKQETQCIMVDSPSSTYLCTENMIPTHNTGMRVDWSTRTMEKKTYEKLCKDPQLMLYYYAARHMYPEAEAIILTIFFVRDGGPFSMSFDDETMVEMERLLEKRFKEVVNCKNPKMLDPRQNNFKCNKLCPFFKHSFDGSDKNMCLETNELIQLHGIDYVTDNYTKEGHSIGTYNAPGE